MRKRYTEEQIVKILTEGQNGKINEVCRKHGISEQTFFNWRNKFTGMGRTGNSSVTRAGNREWSA